MTRVRDDEELSRLGVLAATMGSGASVYHVGFVVADLAEAMATMSAVLRVPFTEPMELPFSTLQTPTGAREVRLRLSYSTRPAHVELIESAPGTLWDADDRRAGHHVGVWSDDVAADVARLDGMGLRRLWWADDDDGRTVFSYHDTPYGFYVELVDAAAKAFFPGWFAAVDPEVAPR